ncbi:MAG: Trm112 family protein [Pelovirga sp.]
MTVAESLLEILVCPLCKKQVDQVETGSYLECGACQLRFPVLNDIPVMLVDEAEKLKTG